MEFLLWVVGAGAAGVLAGGYFGYRYGKSVQADLVEMLEALVDELDVEEK